MQELRLPFDPIKRAKEVEKIVMKGLKRKYYRFRAARYYGGIATSDQVGCCFLCGYCWNYFRNLNPDRCGKFYSPKEVAEKLLKIVERKGFSRIRMSGAEPILGKMSFKHLIRVLQIIFEENSDIDFILETNGLILGHENKLAKELASFPRIFVRVSLKGYDQESFEKISGAKGEFFETPLRGLKRLIELKINAWPAVMFETFGQEGIEQISRKLKDFGIREKLEIEHLEAYNFVLKNLKNRSIELHV